MSACDETCNDSDGPLKEMRKENNEGSHDFGSIDRAQSTLFSQPTHNHAFAVWIDVLLMRGKASSATMRVTSLVSVRQ